MFRAIAVFVTLIFAGSALAKDHLVIISPHRKSLQQAFLPAFKDYYKKTFGTDVEVDWLDQGGTSDDLRFVKAKFKSQKSTSSVDVFWGGGTAVFTELDRLGFLDPYVLAKDLRQDLPKKVATVPLTTANEAWHASAMSSFGIFFNKKVLPMEGLPEPKLWTDLADSKFMGQISLADPRRSGSANTMNNIIIQSLGFEKGMELLTIIGGNTRTYTHSSSDPIKGVVSGDVAVAMAIDFYATAKISELGEANLGLNLPQGQTVLDPDPIAVLRGAPNKKVARRFVDYVLSADAQKSLVLPKGVPFGPRGPTIGRFAVNTRTYAETDGKRLVKQNPFKGGDFFQYDAKKASKMQEIMNDLVGAVIIDTHRDLKKAWKAVVKSGVTPAKLKAIGQMPVTEAELLAAAEKWSDNVYRNKTINSWVAFSKKKYQKLN